MRYRKKPVGEPWTPGMVKARCVIHEVKGCWIWTGSRSRRNYGTMKDGAKNHNVHRWMYERLVGPIQDGMHLDHLCGVEPCCNPAHLEPVTVAENNRRARPIYVHCLHGHEYSDTVVTQKDGSRACRECRRRSLQSSYHRHRDKRILENKKWASKNRDKMIAYMKDYNANYREPRTKEQNAEKWAKQKERINKMKRERYAALRAQGKTSREASRAAQQP